MNGEPRFDADPARSPLAEAHGQRMSEVVEGLFPIFTLPDLSKVHGVITTPLWRVSPVPPMGHKVLALLCDRIQTLDELRILFERGWFSTEEARQGLSSLIARDWVKFEDLKDEDGVMFELDAADLARFKKTGIIIGGLRTVFAEKIRTNIDELSS